MKNKTRMSLPAPCPTDDEIRVYAWLIYEHTGRAPGRDLANWMEAKAWLSAVRGGVTALQPKRRRRSGKRAGLAALEAFHQSE